ncbi:AF4/FMR2 family member 4 isoform X2 [Anabas testudineus]|uniref:AF4/FMR2 family member 4 isoform X2 n=1 Tax=Anabas testudineus TaxID=64144 RepID=UPI000E45F633|nr:AF4/FMR2 family member 4 isoform X2 [Anabas testudineus]
MSFETYQQTSEPVPVLSLCHQNPDSVIITGAKVANVHNEERNRLRLQAWEQRNQETSQTKELNTENVPLFGEPYKTNKGDELSSRIQRMLGSYEDVNNPNPFPTDPSPTPTYVTSQSDQCPPDKSKPPFYTQVHYMTTQTQKGLCSNSYSFQPMRTSNASSSPNQHGHSSTFSKASLKHSQGAQLGHSALEQKKSEAFSDLRDRISLPQEMSAQSPDAKPLDFLHSSDHDNTDPDTKDTFDRHQLQGSTGQHLSASSSTLDVSTLSPKDASLPQASKTTTLPSQTFPPLLSSKQPSAVMTQKPTAYVRPMDGQDQVVSESPELKPSPEPYAPLPELMNQSDQGKTKILPPFVEAKTTEAQCVEDILREMTQSWPPLLTAIHTPSTDEPSKSPLSVTVSECVASRPGQKSSSPTDPSQQNSSFSFKAKHSSGEESASSSDSESSSRSDSESESATEELSQPAVSSSVKTEPDAPAVSNGDWQLGNWIRSNQQNCSTESQGGALVSENPAHKQLLPIQSSKHASVDVVNPIKESKPSSQQKKFSGNIAKPQQCNESPQDNCYQQSSQQSPSDSCKLSFNIHSSKPAKAGCPDHTEAALGVKCDEVSATQAKEPCFTDRPKVKTKIRPSKKRKDGSDTKGDKKRTSKHSSLDKRKAGSEPEPEVALVLYGHCPSCGVRYPNPCSCPTQSPTQPDQLSPAPPVRISCGKVKPETTCQKGIKMPHKTTHKHLEKTRHTTKSSGDLDRSVRSLLVKIDLSLLSRVPQTSRGHQEIPQKRSALVIERDEGGSDASTIPKRTKTSKKSIPQNAEVDDKARPRKRQKLENKNTSSTSVSAKLERSSNPAEEHEQKKAKKNHVQSQLPLTPKDTSKDSKLHKARSQDAQESSKADAKSKDSSKHKKRSLKQTEHPHIEKKAVKSSLTVLPPSQSKREVLTNRPLLTFEERQYPVKHYIKEAKRLKHKADAETNKLSKAFNYLDAAMFFVESGIAMEKDPQISLSSYTMFAETVELLKFVLKLKNSVDPSTSPSEKDFLALCLKCQSLLQMAMFRHKHKTALEYSKTLTDHFNSSAQAPPDPSISTSKVTNTSSCMPCMPSPANTSTSSDPGSNSVATSSGLVGSTVALPHAINQVTFNYVNITTLFLSAHDVWEQADELAHKGSGMLTELDAVMGPLSLTSSMSSMVRYTRQGVHWLRLDIPKVK